MARVHAAAVRFSSPGLTAVATASAQGAVAAARELGIPRAEAATSDLISAPDIDIVHICTPNATHADLARSALRSGLHVVCEKPLATTVEDARDLVSLAAERSVVAAVPFIYRYHPMVRAARARVSSGGLGAVLSIDACYLQDWMSEANDDDWRADPLLGGPSRAFADIGSHLCDLVEFVSGDSIVRLAATTRRFYDVRGGRSVANEDMAALLFETETGTIGTATISQMAPGRKNALILELHGTSESVRFEQERPEELWVGRRTQSQLLLRAPANSTGAARKAALPPGHPMGYQDAFNAFVADVHEAVRGGSPDGLPTFRDGLRAVVLTEAVLQAAKSKQWIEVPR